MADIIDFNVWCGRWHRNPLSLDTPARISRHLGSSGISMAVISTCEGIFWDDPDAANRKLIKLAAAYSGFIPVPVIRPTLSDWRETLQGYMSLPFRAVRLLPGYHGYSLASPELDAFFQACGRYGFLVMIQMRMEDERSHHPLVKVPPVSCEDVISLALRFKAMRFVCLAAYFKEVIFLCGKAENIYADISFAEKLNTVSSLIGEVGYSRLLFGSHTPFLYTRAALLKMEYSDVDSRYIRALSCENASGLIARFSSTS